VALTDELSACQLDMRMVNVAPREHSRQGASVIAEHESALRQLAERLCANRADAHDLVQDTFERATRQGLPAELRSPRAWLVTMMHHLFIDRCRAEARRPSHEQLDESAMDAGVGEESDGPEPPWARVTLHDVRAALAAIDRTFREVYVMHTFDKLSYEQIAGRLGIERVTVGTRLNRARKKLREVLVARFGLEASAP
jgi:RNA polymerase sigma-70 factor (ECF subfamily)